MNKNNKSRRSREQLEVQNNIVEEAEDSKIEDIDLDEIKEELTSYMKEKIDEEISKTTENIKVNSKDIDTSLVKEELSMYMKGKIDSEISTAIERANKKIIKHKNGIIIKRDIFIVVLLVVCFFLGYNLYNISNITIDIKREVKNVSNNGKANIKKEEKKEKEEVNTDINELAKKYEYLVKEISVSEDSDYLKDFYEGKLTDEIRLYISFDNLDSSLVNSDDETTFVEENALKEKYEELFDAVYESKSFKYNDINFKYLQSKEMYFGAGKLRKNGTAIKKEIIDIKEDDNLIITTVEGIVSKDKLYSILDNKEISDYKGDSLKNYKDSLVKLEYSFKKIDDSFKLVEINVK